MTATTELPCPGSHDDNKAKVCPTDQNKTMEQPRSFEDVLAAMGPPGRYQFVQIAMIMTCNIPMVFLFAKYVFISQESSFVCAVMNETDLINNHLEITHGYDSYRMSYNQSCDVAILKNESGTWSRVKTIGCPRGYSFDDGKDKSFISEWGLVCDKEGLSELSQTAFAIGGFFGGIVTNIIGDVFGRWKTLTGSIILTGVVDIATVFAPDIYWLIAIRFLAGVVSTGMYICSYLLPFELVIEKYRIIYAAIAGVLWSVTVVFFAGVGYALRSFGWRDFQLYTSFIGLVPLLFVYFINESPSWLQSAGHSERSEGIIRQACKANGVNYDTVQDVFEECNRQRTRKTEPASDYNENKTNNYNAFDLFKNRRTLVIILITGFASFTNELTSSGLYLTVSTLAGDLYLNTALLGMVSVPSYFISWVMLLYKGRRFVIMLFTVLSGICLLISPLLTYGDMNESITEKMSLAFFVIGKFAISSAYNTLYLYIPELFPTNLRASGMGIALNGITVGAAIAPYLLPLSKVASWAPGAILASCCLLTTILFTKLPETRGKKLTNALDDKNCVDQSGDENEIKVFSVGKSI